MWVTATPDDYQRIYLTSLGCMVIGGYCLEQSQSACTTSINRLLSGICCTTNILKHTHTGAEKTCETVPANTCNIITVQSMVKSIVNSPAQTKGLFVWSLQVFAGFAGFCRSPCWFPPSKTSMFRQIRDSQLALGVNVRVIGECLCVHPMYACVLYVKQVR